MNTKHLILGFVAIAIILVIATSGCIREKGSLQERFARGLFDDNSTATPEDRETVLNLNEKIDVCLKETSEAKADSCLIDLAVNSLDDSPCEFVALFPQGRCFLSVGVEASNTFYCGKIIDPETKDSCFSEVGKKVGDPDICIQILNDQKARDECYDNAAIKTKNHEACDPIFDPTARDECYISVARVASDVTFCEKASTRRTSDGIQRDICYASSKNKLTGEFCAKLMDGNLRSVCFSAAENTPSEQINCNVFDDEDSRESCSEWYATYSGDTSLCYELDVEDQENCLNEAIETSTTMQTCNSIKDKHYKIRNSCYTKVAVESEDKDICKTIISDSKERDNCLTWVALAIEDSSICKEITGNNISGKDSCYSQVALKTKNTFICESIQTDQSYHRCFSEIALSFGFPGVCKDALREDLRLLPYPGTEYCYKNYAVETIDKDICDKISFSSLVEECKQDVEIAIICVDGDGVCDENICDLTNDTDCNPRLSCTSNADCNDNRVATSDTCSGGVCSHTPIVSCIDGDWYCPGFCTYVGDPNTSGNDDSDCVRPETCTNDDGVCPSMCTYVDDPNEDPSKYDNECPLPSCSSIFGITCGENEVCESGVNLIAQEAICCDSGDTCKTLTCDELDGVLCEGLLECEDGNEIIAEESNCCIAFEFCSLP